MKASTASLNFNGLNFLFSFRPDSIGDRGVMQQIFGNRDYSIAHWEQGRRLIEYHNQHSLKNPSLIIDAGANIGASAVYFSKTFRNTLVFAIEPDTANWNLLKVNTSKLNVFNFHGAISDVDGELALVDPGQSDWGFRTAESQTTDTAPATKVKSISPASILSHPATANTTPLILKIDIEGGEDSLFRGNTDWLARFPMIVIELHDWMLPFSGSSRNFIKAVADHDFDLVHRGENIFLFNRNILKH